MNAGMEGGKEGGMNGWMNWCVGKKESNYITNR